jgi:hypothetical protein
MKKARRIAPSSKDGDQSLNSAQEVVRTGLLGLASVALALLRGIEGGIGCPHAPHDRLQTDAVFIWLSPAPTRRGATWNRNRRGFQVPCPKRAAVLPCSVVKRRSDLPLSPADVIVLNPQLGVILFHECFDALAALRGLLSIRVGDRNFLKRHLFRIVIEIA